MKIQKSLNDRNCQFSRKELRKAQKDEKSKSGKRNAWDVDDDQCHLNEDDSIRMRNDDVADDKEKSDDDGYDDESDSEKEGLDHETQSSNLNIKSKIQKNDKNNSKSSTSPSNQSMSSSIQIPHTPQDLIHNTDNHNNSYSAIITEESLSTQKDVIERKLLKTLRNWAVDNNINHEKAVKLMYAKWHPDKFFPDHHIQNQSDSEVLCTIAKDHCKSIFQSIQSEVQKLLEAKQRRQKKFEEAQAVRQAKIAQKQGEKKALKGYMQKNSDLSKTSQANEIELSIDSDKFAIPPTADSKSEDNQNQNLFKDSLIHRPLPRSHFSMTQLLNVSGAKDQCHCDLFFFGGECVTGASEKTAFHGDMGVFRLEILNHNVNEDDDGDITEGIHLNQAKVTPKIWTPTTTMSESSNGPSPSARSAHQTCLSPCGTKLYLFGGEWQSACTRRFKQFDDLWILDLKTGKWKEIVDSDFTANDQDGNQNDDLKVQSKHDSILSRLGKSNSTKNSKKSNISSSDNLNSPCPRSGHRMVITQENKLFLFGGFHEPKKSGNGTVKYLNDFYYTDLATLTCKWIKDRRRSGKKPSPRSGHCMWSDEKRKRIYVFGGTTNKSSTSSSSNNNSSSNSNSNVVQALADLWYFDLENFEWVEVTAKSDSKDAEDSAQTVTDSITHTSLLKVFGKKVEKTRKMKSLFTSKQGLNEEMGKSGNKTKDDRPQVQGRSGLSCCYIKNQDRVIFFGGVSDVKQDTSTSLGLSLFHNDIISLDLETLEFSTVCSATTTQTDSLQDLESSDVTGALDYNTTVLSLSQDNDLNIQRQREQFLKKLSKLSKKDQSRRKALNTTSTDSDDHLSKTLSQTIAPRGRIASQITTVVNDQYLIVFGGCCEAGSSSHDYTLDDMWMFDLKKMNWSNILPLSDRAYGLESDDDDDDDETSDESSDDSSEENLDQTTKFCPKKSKLMVERALANSEIGLKPLLKVQKNDEAKKDIDIKSSEPESKIIVQESDTENLNSNAAATVTTTKPSHQVKFVNSESEADDDDDSDDELPPTLVTVNTTNVVTVTDKLKGPNPASPAPQPEMPAAVLQSELNEAPAVKKIDDKNISSHPCADIILSDSEAESDVDEQQEELQKNENQKMNESQNSEKEDEEEEEEDDVPLPIQETVEPQIQQQQLSHLHKPIINLLDVTDPSTLRKKDKIKWEKKMRSEVKAVKSQEKAAKKDLKKEQKMQKQKEKAGKRKGKGNSNVDEGESEEE